MRSPGVLGSSYSFPSSALEAHWQPRGLGLVVLFSPIPIFTPRWNKLRIDADLPEMPCLWLAEWG